MKKAICVGSAAGQTVKDKMALVKKAGYDGVELSLNETGETSLESTPEEWIDLFEFSKKIDLKIHSVTTGLYWSYPFTSDCPDVREKAVSVALKQLEAAKAVGADGVLIVPGAVGVIFIPGFKPVPYDAAYDRALSAFMRIKKDAERLQIHIGVENVWNQFLLSPLEMRDFIDKIDSTYVGAYLDVGNVIATGYPEHWIHILGKRIRKVHFKDYRRGAGGLHGFVDLLAGDVDWAAVMEAFKAVGYDGWATAEMDAYAHYPDQIVFNTKAAMDRICG